MIEVYYFIIIHHFLVVIDSETCLNRTSLGPTLVMRIDSCSYCTGQCNLSKQNLIGTNFSDEDRQLFVLYRPV